MTKNNQETSSSTEIIFILDRSGSMADLTDDTIGGFNSMIQKQKKESGNAFVTTVLFDDSIETLYSRVPIEEIRPLTDKEYYARGCTALLDAVGSTINRIKWMHRTGSETDVPTKTLFVIVTDGYENSSEEFSAKQVKDLVKEQQEKYGWDFLFLGANIDAIETASHIGISADHTANVMGDKKGTKIMYKELSDAVCRYRKVDVQYCRLEKWKANIDKDYNSRSGKVK